MSPKAVRLGIAGCGLVVERGYLPALAAIREMQLVAVADPLPDRRRLVPDVAAYADVQDMVRAGNLDAVLICTPPELHLEHAQQSAAAGLPTLVEKPPGVTLEDARRLAAIRPEPMIGFNRRFAHGLPTRQARDHGVSRITAIFDAPPGDWERTGVPADPLWDFGCHLVDLGCWLTCRRPARARARSSGARRTRFEIEMDDGCRLYGECGAATAYRELLELRDRRGSAATWSWPRSRRGRIADRLMRRPPPLIASWRAQLRAFAAAVRGAPRGCLASATDAIQVVAALDAVQASAAGDLDWVTISLAHERPDAPVG